MAHARTCEVEATLAPFNLEYRNDVRPMVIELKKSIFF